MIYVTDYGSNTVSELYNAAVVKVATIGRGPAGLSFNQATNKMYVSNFNSATVSKIK